MKPIDDRGRDGVSARLNEILSERILVLDGAMGSVIYASGVGIEPRGVFLGTYAIGVYVEAGVRDVASDLGAFQMSGGLTFRTPLVFAP